MKKLKVIPRAMRKQQRDCYLDLTMLQRKARDGEIQGIVYITINSSNCGQVESVGSGWAGDGVNLNVHATLGGIEALKARFIREKDL